MNNPKRVLHIFSSLNLAGAESRVMDLYRSIDKNKLQFDFIVLKPGPFFFEEEIKKLGGNIYKITDPKESIFKNIKDMINVMRNKGPFIAVHSHTSYYNGISMLAAKKANIKIRIAHARNSSNNNLNLIKWIQIIIGRSLIKKYATDKISISKAAAKFVFGSIDNVKIIPNAIDIERFLKSDAIDIKKLNEKLELNESKVLIMVARFIEFKNHKFAIDVLEELVKKRNLNYKLLLVGKGNIEENIERYVAKKELQNNILFLGLRTDIPELNKISDIFLVPSKFEGLCGACIEAQASGTKCLISEEVPEEADMKLGLVYRETIHKGSKVWADKIEEIIDEKIELSSEEIRKKFMQRKFTLDEEKKQILKIYKLE